MNIKNIDLLRCVSPMRLLSEAEGIPFTTALALSKNISAIDIAIENYLSKKEQLNQKYVESCGDKTTVKPGFEEEYLRALTLLNDERCEVTIEPIDPKSLSGITLKPKYIDSILFMLKL